MKKLFCMLIVAMTPVLSGCLDNGSSAPPPPWLPSTGGATQGDGRVKLEWIPTPGVDYWLFSATDASLTALNWTGLPNAHAYTNAATPFYMCGLIDDMTYYFATNGRTSGGPGGSSSPTISAKPYNASTKWLPSIAAPTQDIYGVGYTSLTTCGNNATISSTGMFAAVGAGGAIFTSGDGMSWSPEVSPTLSNLNAVTGYAANQNNALTPALRWMAVGDAGTVTYYQDGTGWVLANNLAGSTLITANPFNKTLRSITHVAGTFYAVGDAGTIISSSDAITWYRRPYTTATNPTNATSQNLNGVTHGGIFVAVGDNGTILTSGDGNTWAPPTTTPAIPAGINLRQVTSYVSIYGTIYVAVGDAGTIVTSKDGGATWITQPAPTGLPLVGITAETRAVDTTAAPAVDPSLGFVSTAQFVAIDSAGNAYTSVNGYTWIPAPVSTGISCSTSTSCMNPLVSSGFGYVAAGNAGVAAYAF